MADSTPAPDPNNPAKKRSSPGDLDKQSLADIKLGEDILEAANDPDAPDRLTKLNDELGDDSIAQLTTATGAARSLAPQVVEKKTTARETTKTERDALKAVLAAIHPIHNRIKTVYAGNKQKSAEYRIGKKNLGGNRDEAEQDFPTIIDNAEKDTALAIKPPVIKAARDAVKAWKSADETQQRADDAVTDVLGQLEKIVAGINKYRRNVQLAADTVWPHTDKANAATRKAFDLPASRAMS